MKHLMNFNELYDSKFDKDRIEVTPEELKKMISMDHEHKYEPGKWNGENSYDLNVGIIDYTANNKYSKFDRYGILDELNRKVINIIPEMSSKFTLVTNDLDSHTKFSYNREIILAVSDLDDDYSIKMNLYIKYNFKNHEIFEDEMANTFNILFSPTITTNRTSVDIGGDNDATSSFKLPTDVSDDKITRVLFRLDKLLSGTPDIEDKQINKKFKLTKRGLRISELDNILKQIKENLNGFETYIYGKYNIKILE